MTASFLRASLFTSVVAFGVALLVVGLGVVLILVGWAIRHVGKAAPPSRWHERCSGGRDDRSLRRRDAAPLRWLPTPVAADATGAGRSDDPAGAADGSAGPPTVV